MSMTTPHPSGVHPTAKVARSAKIGLYAVIMEGVSIGEHTLIGNNVVIYPGTRIGKAVTVYDNAVLGRKPQTTGVLFRPLNTKLPPLVIRRGTVIGACAVIYTGTQIGREVLIADGASIREENAIGDNVLLGRGVILNYANRVGKGTKIMDQTLIAGNCVIGEDCFISANVTTTNENSMGLAEVQEHLGVIIGDRARVGAGAIILPGKRIGKDAFVSAGSFVSINIPDGVLAGGNPARVIRDNPYLKKKR